MVAGLRFWSFAATLVGLAGPASASGPDVSGYWTGSTNCPLGRTEFTIEIKGASGTIRQKFSDPSLAQPATMPVKISSFEGHQGTWIRLNAPEHSEYNSALLLPGGSTMKMDGPGDCSDFLITRGPDPSIALNPSKAGPPNGDAIIMAKINEYVAMGGKRLGHRNFKYSLLEGSFDPVRVVKCTAHSAKAYTCESEGRLVIKCFNPSSNPIIDAACQVGNQVNITRSVHRFENVGGTWRSSTYHAELVRRANESR